MSNNGTDNLTGLNKVQRERLERVNSVLDALDRDDVSGSDMMDTLEDFHGLGIEINIQRKLAEAKIEARKRES